MMTVLLGIRQDNAILKTDILSTLDSKMSHYKEELTKDLVNLSEAVSQHSGQIDSIQKTQKASKLEVQELDSKVQSVEDEIEEVRKLSLKDSNTMIEQITNVENSLAQDLESVKVNIEAKFEETKKHQILAENRIIDMSEAMQKDNDQIKIELDQMREVFERMTRPKSENQSKVEYSDASVDYCSGISNWSGSEVGSASLHNPVPLTSEYVAQHVNYPPDIPTNIDRSIIISGVRENPRENLKLIILDCIHDIGITCRVSDIEKAYRIGDWDPNNKRPRPVKCVFFDQVKRDQVLYFKSRLRHSMLFNGFKINKEEHKDLRVKGAILRQAAILARDSGHDVYERPDSVTIDGIKYSLDQVDIIPVEFRCRNATDSTDKTDFDKARDRAEHVIIVGPSLQKLSYGLGFFSSNCFLSNFYSSEIVHRGVSYKTVEHGYQALKATTCGDLSAYRAVMSAKYPAEAKRAGVRVNETLAWRSVKLEIMEELLYCKFRQHRSLYYQLLNTRPHDLFECTLCDFWGTGCKLGSIALEENSWVGTNHLGKLLMRVRASFARDLERN